MMSMLIIMTRMGHTRRLARNRGGAHELVENAVYIAYTLAHHGCFQVRRTGVPARLPAPITSCDDERTHHAKFYTPRRFHLL